MLHHHTVKSRSSILSHTQPSVSEYKQAMKRTRSTVVASPYTDGTTACIFASISAICLYPKIYLHSNLQFRINASKIATSTKLYYSSVQYSNPAEDTYSRLLILRRFIPTVLTIQYIFLSMQSTRPYITSF